MKIKMDIDELHVETFAAEKDGDGERGSVHAHDTAGSCHPLESCHDTCGLTCTQDTCGLTCYETCPVIACP